MNLPEPKLIGFFPKLPCPKPNGIKNDTVKEICSVSNCISEGPENWIDKWKHNEIGFYNSEEIMLPVLKKYREKYNFFASKLYPLIFINGAVKDYKISLNLKTILSDYNFLGFDIVSRSSLYEKYRN